MVFYLYISAHPYDDCPTTSHSNRDSFFISISDITFSLKRHVIKLTERHTISDETRIELNRIIVADSRKSTTIDV